MPPPRSRMRIVRAGTEGELPSSLMADPPVGDFEVVSSGSGDDAAMVISTGSRSWPVSMVARKAFLRSSVRMYSRWVGT